jgi:hypothetical protein
MNDDRRAVLEAIAYGDDPSIKPAERLKALELLGPADDDGFCVWCRDIRSLSASELDELTDDWRSVILLCMTESAVQEKWPNTVKVINWIIEEHSRKTSTGSGEQAARC